MGDVSNRTVVALLAVALVVTVVGTVVSVSKLSTLDNSYGVLTGAATGTGTSSLTVQGVAGITIVDNAIAFGTGYVNSTCTKAFLASDGEGYLPANCWVNISGTNADIDDFHFINNSGTGAVVLNATLQGNNASEDICGADACSSSTSAYIMVKATDSFAACSAGLQSSYVELAANHTATNVTLCSNFLSTKGADALEVNYNLTIPDDTEQGAKTITIAYFAELA